MEELLPGVFAVQSPVFELLASMFRLQAHEQLTRGDFAGLAEFDLDLWVDRVRGSLPDDVKQGLEVFFDVESFIGLSMVGFAWRTDAWRSVDAFLTALRAASPHALFESFLQTGFTPEDFPAVEDTERLRAYIARAALPPREKWKLAYLYLEREGTKQQFITLVEQCNALYFSAEWHRLSQIQAANIAELRAKVRSRQDLKREFPYLYLRDAETRVVLAPSVFYHVDSLSAGDDDGNFFITVYGVHMAGLWAGQVEIVPLLKVLADDTRIKIIKALHGGEKFGYELAERLSLSSSTVSHHLGHLAAVGLVVGERDENRVYYRLDVKRLRQLLAVLAQELGG